MPDNFRPGHRAPFSGVYRAIHAGSHSPPHELTILHGESFPSCVECSDEVVFELMTAAVHVNAHPMFRRF